MKRFLCWSWTNRKYVCLNLKVSLFVFDAVWGRILPSCALRRFSFNVWNGVILAMDEHIIESTFVLLHVWIWRCHMLVFHTVTLWSNPHALSKYNDYGSALLVSTQCVERGRIGLARTNSLYVCMMLNLKMQYNEIAISPSCLRFPKTLTTMLDDWTSLNVWNGVVLALDKKPVRLHGCLLEFEVGVRRNLTLMCCPNSTQRWLYAYFSALNVWYGVSWVSYWSSTKRTCVCLYYYCLLCVCIWRCCC